MQQLPSGMLPSDVSPWEMERAYNASLPIAAPLTQPSPLYCGWPRPPHDPSQHMGTRFYPLYRFCRPVACLGGNTDCCDYTTKAHCRHHSQESGAHNLGSDDMSRVSTICRMESATPPLKKDQRKGNDNQNHHKDSHRLDQVSGSVLIFSVELGFA